MATVGRKTYDSSAKALALDWEGFMQSLAWPSGLSKKDRMTLFRQGKRDARHGLVGINEYGEIVSPYCEGLVQSANRRIAVEWMNCDKYSLSAKACIDQIELKVEELNRQLKEATVRRDEALDVIARRRYGGDEAVSEHLALRRRLNREKPVLEAFERESQAINAELLEVETEAIPHRYVLSQAEEAAMSHEQLVRTDYLWRLSVYAYGASNYIKITPDMINDSALSGEPRERHEAVFSGTKAGNTGKEEQW